MELYKISVNMTLVLVTPDDCEPSQTDIMKALKKEVEDNGFMPGDIKKKVLTKRSKIPEHWEFSIPWPTEKGINKKEKTIVEILRDNK
jgi:hypothetical protein